MKLILKASRVLPGLLLGMSFAATAVEPPATQATAGTQSAQSGMKVGFDKKTGKFRPLSAEESQQLDRTPVAAKASQLTPAGNSFARPANQAASRATVRRNAGGGVSVKLPEDQMSTVVVRRDASGQLQISEQSGEHDDGASAQNPGVASE